jgi:hypothetical protein
MALVLLPPQLTVLNDIFRILTFQETKFGDSGVVIQDIGVFQLS